MSQVHTQTSVVKYAAHQIFPLYSIYNKFPISSLTAANQACNH